MLLRSCGFLFLLLFMLRGCSNTRLQIPGIHSSPQLKFRAVGSSPEQLAVYEGWFGMPGHISVGYSSHDAKTIRRQIEEAKARGIGAFVVDWYGDRQPFIDKTYALMQPIAAKEHFHVAIMYDETHNPNGAADQAIADLTMFHDTYLSPQAPGHDAYLTYDGRPVIFVFPTQGQTNWDEVRKVIDQWNPKPLLIDEFLPKQYVNAFDGFYAWVNPGPKGWAADGSHWGEGYLDHYYQTMRSQYSDKIIVGGAWPGFNDSKASWGLNRHMSARCGQTYSDTLNFWKKYFPPDQPIPFMMLETWNDYEEGTQIEPGIPSCSTSPTPAVPTGAANAK